MKLISIDESSGPVFLIMLLNPSFMEVLWTFSDMLATLCFTWVAKKLILMFQFSYTTAIQKTVTSCIWEMMAFSYDFIKCIDFFGNQFSITSSVLILTFLLVSLRFFSFTVLQIPPTSWVSVSIYFPSNILTCLFHKPLILWLPAYISDPSRTLWFMIKQTCS